MLLMGLFAIERQKKKPIIFLAIVLVVSHPVWLSENLQWRIVNLPTTPQLPNDWSNRHHH